LSYLPKLFDINVSQMTQGMDFYHYLYKIITTYNILIITATLQILKICKSNWSSINL